MATFTRIEEGDSPSITIHPNHKIAEIDNNIYGGFTEYEGYFPCSVSLS